MSSTRMIYPVVLFLITWNMKTRVLSVDTCILKTNQYGVFMESLSISLIGLLDVKPPL